MGADWRKPRIIAHTTMRCQINSSTLEIDQELDPPGSHQVFGFTSSSSMNAPESNHRITSSGNTKPNWPKIRHWESLAQVADVAVPQQLTLIEDQAKCAILRKPIFTELSARPY